MRSCILAFLIIACFVHFCKANENSTTILGMKEQIFFSATFKYIEGLLNATANASINGTDVAIRFKNVNTENMSFIFNPNNNYLICDLFKIWVSINIKQKDQNSTLYNANVKKFFIELQFNNTNSTDWKQSNVFLRELELQLDRNITNLASNGTKSVSDELQSQVEKEVTAYIKRKIVNDINSSSLISNISKHASEIDLNSIKIPSYFIEQQENASSQNKTGKKLGGLKVKQINKVPSGHSHSHGHSHDHSHDHHDHSHDHHGHHH